MSTVRAVSALTQYPVEVVGWLNVANVTAVDGQSATTSATVAGSATLESYNYFFGLLLPDDAVIVGVALQVRAAAAAPVTLAGQLSLGTILSGDELSCEVGGTGLAWYALGGPAELWGLTLARVDVVDDWFGAGIHLHSPELPTAVSVDAVRLCVYYTSESLDAADAELLPKIALRMGGRRHRLM